MSGNFFEELGIPEPHINLESVSGTQAEQTANIMVVGITEETTVMGVPYIKR